MCSVYCVCSVLCSQCNIHGLYAYCLCILCSKCALLYVVFPLLTSAMHCVDCGHSQQGADREGTEEEREGQTRQAPRRRGEARYESQQESISILLFGVLFLYVNKVRSRQVIFCVKLPKLSFRPSVAQLITTNDQGPHSLDSI